MRDRAAKGTGAAPLRAAVYARVSTDEQAQGGTSVDSQVSRATEVIERKGWATVGEYVDAGVSGTKESRPQLDRLLSDCASGLVDVVVVKSFDRIARRARLGLALADELASRDVSLVLLDMDIDTTTTAGRLFMTQLLAFAEYDHGEIYRKMRLGSDARVQQGLRPCGRLPFGYRSTDNPQGSGRVAVHHESEAETIRKAVSLLVDEGLGLTEVAARLNALGMRPRPRGSLKSDDPTYGWAWRNLRIVLSNRALTGVGPTWRTLEGDEVPVRFPPILDDATFEIVQRLIAAKPRSQRKHRTYPLSGRVFGTCGEYYVFTWKNDRDRVIARCNGKVRGSNCTDRQIDAAAFDEVTRRTIVDMLSSPEWLHKMATDWIAADASRGGGPSVEDLRTRLAKVEDNARSARVRGLALGMDADEIREAAGMADAEARSIREELDARDLVQADPSEVDRLSRLVREARTRLETLSDEELKALFTLLDVRVTIERHKEGRTGSPSVLIEARAPLGALATALEQGTDWNMEASNPRGRRRAG